MAAGTLPRPGTEYGPCTDACSHIDCSATRLQAGYTCRYCGAAIGYETRFYQEGAGNYVHALCAEKEAER